MRDDRVGHVVVGLIVADVFVGELILEDLIDSFKWVNGRFAFSKDAQSEEHDPRSGIEIADGELSLGQTTSRRRR